MTKAASSVYVLIFLLAASAPLRAQTDAADVSRATEEAVRRQAWMKQLRETLAQAQGAVARRDLVSARKLYGDCYELVRKIGPTSGALGQQTVAGLDSG